MLHHDLLAVAAAADDDALAQLVHDCFRTHSPDWELVRRTAIDFIMDPSATCKQTGSTLPTIREVQKICSAFCHGVGAAVTGEILDDFPAIMRCLPRDSQVAMALADLIRSGPDNAPDSDCEEWVNSDTESGTGGADILLDTRTCWRIRDPLDTDVPRCLPGPSPVSSGLLHKRPADDFLGEPAPPLLRVCRPSSAHQHIPFNVAPAQPAQVALSHKCTSHGTNALDIASDSDDELPFDGRPASLGDHVPVTVAPVQPARVRVSQTHHTSSAAGGRGTASDSEDELPFDGLACTSISCQNASSLSAPPSKRHRPADRFTDRPVLHPVPAPASVPSPSGLRGRCPEG